jgi:CRISPR-associated endonuclease/helicase Cas3
LLAATIHDIGKANNHFQDMLARTRNILENPQGLRHEWASILMLKALKQWLLPALDGNEVDFAIVEWAIAGHHPATHHASPPRECVAGSGTEIEILAGHKDFAEITTWLADVLKLTAGPLPSGASVLRSLVGYANVFGELAVWSKSAQRVWEEKVKRIDDRKLVAAVKNCLIAADIAGSALPKTSLEVKARWTWIDRGLNNRPEPGDLRCVAEHRLGKDQPRQFQMDVANSDTDVTFVKAGCGTGKTLAAYMWAAKNHPLRRLYFCYPTTGTATEGFKDYLFEPNGALDQLEATLFHSRRDVDFEIILNAGPDTQSPTADDVAKLESLESWSTPIVACTVDTVLGLVQNNKRGLFAWPALAQSAFVFDEIHSFDDRLFGALLRFLRDLPGLPALLMTASLPKAREEALATVLKQYRGIDLKPIAGQKALEELPRYHKIIAPNNDPLPLIKEAVQGGGKVLWVCNTVKRVMDAAKRARDLGMEPLIYHSRFKYVHRVHRHKEVVEAFTPEHQEGVLAICSQVAEMSLDLKGCTLLVTDLAPVPALIQRLGRLNRQAKEGDQTRPFVIITVDNHLPYTPPSLEAAAIWLKSVGEADICQRDLADKWEQEGDQPPECVPSAWLDGGPVTTVTELREASPGITVLMREDMAQINSAKNAVKFTLPMPQPPRNLDWRSWQVYKGIPIAEPGTIIYSEMEGAEWRK